MCWQWSVWDRRTIRNPSASKSISSSGKEARLRWRKGTWPNIFNFWLPISARVLRWELEMFPLWFHYNNLKWFVREKFEINQKTIECGFLRQVDWLYSCLLSGDMSGDTMAPFLLHFVILLLILLFWYLFLESVIIYYNYYYFYYYNMEKRWTDLFKVFYDIAATSPSFPLQEVYSMTILMVTSMFPTSTIHIRFPPLHGLMNDVRVFW